MDAAVRVFAIDATASRELSAGNAQRADGMEAQRINDLSPQKPRVRLLSSVASTRRSLARMVEDLRIAQAAQGKELDPQFVDRMSRVYERLARLIASEQKAKRSQKLLHRIDKLTETLSRGGSADREVAAVIASLQAEREGEDAS
jgi:hypothetical protein